MAERKRGLGRGLGALIPDVVTEERPVDVFFPEGVSVSRETKRRTPNDPAEGMAESRRGRQTDRGKSKAGTNGRSSSAKKPAAADSQRAKTQAAVDKPTTEGSKKKPGSSGTTATEATAPDPAESGSNTTERKSDGVTDNENSADVSRETDLLSVPGTAFGLLPIDLISANPKQPRTVFDEDALDELVASIQTVGVLQPIVVRLTDASEPHYELIMGERRLKASQMAGLKEIPAIIREVQDNDLLRDALLENLHRADLNPLEEAAAYQQLLDDFQCTQDELSKRIGRSRPQITNTLRLLRLPSLVQRRVAAGVISQGHARALLGLEDPSAMETLAQRIVAEGLSVRATEEAVVLLNRGQKARVSRETKQVDPELQSIARSIEDHLDTRVNIVMGKRKGKISVDFANSEDLERILKALGIEH